MNFGEKIDNVTGTRDRCTITFNNGRIINCYGEIVSYGFCIYKDCLNLEPEEIERLQEMLKQLAAERKDSLKITIE